MPIRHNVILTFTTILAASAAHAQVPILMYHAHENLGYDTDDFRDHMEFLANNGYNSIDMDQFYEWHQNDAVLPLRPVVITVDDNYILGYTEMYPVFQEFGHVAINYTHTQGIGIGAPKASWEQIREMDGAGVFLVESHSRTHPYMTQLTPGQLFDEVHGSRDDIADNVNGKVALHFCYPYGDYNQAVIDELVAAGFITATTTISGFNFRNTPLYELRRFGADGRDLQQFVNLIGFNNLPPPPPGEGWILDDADPHAYYDDEEWEPSASITGYYGGGYRAREEGGAGASSLRWAAILPETGVFRVHARWTAFDNRASNATYTIRTANGDMDVTVDQRINGGQWNELGTFAFAEGEPVEVLLGGESDGYLIADAIWFETVEETRVDGWLMF